MTRRFATVLALALYGLVPSAPAKAVHLEGGVTLVRGPNYRIFSSGDVYAMNDNGSVNYFVYVSATHAIRDADTLLSQYSLSYSALGGFSTSIPGATGIQGLCYIATYNSTAAPLGLYAEFLSPSLVCFRTPLEKPPLDNCPLILDLGMNGVRLSGPLPAVYFDLDSDGQAEPLAWTRAAGDEAFLCMDRNGNGTMDDGRELFGYSTTLASGEHAGNGYRALEELDSAAFGGNGDGRIDASDPAYSQLCVWRDWNRNGISETGELSSLVSADVVALGTAYQKSHIRDAFGNELRYVGRSWMRRSGRILVWPTYDVVFQDGEP
jgi:hypothetical protein